MSIDEKLKKGDFVLIKRGVESSEKNTIKFVRDVGGYIKKINGDYADVDVTFEDEHVRLTYRLEDLQKY